MLKSRSKQNIVQLREQTGLRNDEKSSSKKMLKFETGQSFKDGRIIQKSISNQYLSRCFDTQCFENINYRGDIKYI